ncbi:hypothetical protein [Pontibacillus sp. HMF3514]|uniref:hypothetical protein n=1 Tax=Pontibacillus sp. HMF3514 TaxID=2692425 RepID=UPI00131F8B28|nr:hypothetical protein [Pontibacillus sp. HMF3514]QHE52465.1 hypothetical protein GS400_10665 [Pontibacillus sp. HMF3514]
MVLLIMLTVVVYSALMIGLLAKLKDQHVLSLLNFVQGNKLSKMNQKQKQYENALLTR